MDYRGINHPKTITSYVLFNKYKHILCECAKNKDNLISTREEERREQQLSPSLECNTGDSPVENTAISCLFNCWSVMMTSLKLCVNDVSS